MAVKAGEFWYAMQDPSGEPQGYAHLQVEDLEHGTQRFRWDLHLAWPGGSYEEERGAVFAASGKMLEASYLDAKRTVEAKREGTRLVGVLRAGETEDPIDLAVEDDAMSGMGFVLAASLPDDEGYEQSHADYNEVRAFESAGRCILAVGSREVLRLPEGAVETRRNVLRRADGQELPLWVDGVGRLVQADWGGGNLMVLHPESTQSLFRGDSTGSRT